MSILTATRVGKAFGADDIFDDISVEIPHGAKIALVGPNGAGKTTLIRILIGLDTPTTGTVTRARGIRIGYLPQRPELSGARTLWDEMLTAFEDLRRREAQLTELAQDMGVRPDDEALLARYGQLQHDFELAGGYEYELRIRQVLQGLGFEPDDYQKPLTILSGGQQTRALLARLLLEAPDLLVLDEPTNHLDIQAVEWLESFLNTWKGAVLLVSHDRYFMDRVVSVIWELDWGSIELYTGNYSAYARQQEARWEYRMGQFEVERNRLLSELDYVKRNIVRASTNPQAVGRLRRLSRDIIAIQQMGMVAFQAAKSWSQTGVGSVRSLTVAEADQAIRALRPATIRPRSAHMRLNLQANVRSGDKVLMTRQLQIGYQDDGVPLFEVPDLTLYRGEVAAVIGPNGVGKTTFLKTLLEQLPPLAGYSKLGAQVKIGYFAQAHELLNPANTILDEILAVKNLPISQARDYLGNFLFSGDDVFRPISTLSGGERGRVALAKLALDGANFLLLDEPTNHLDIPAQEVLQDMLARFDGTIMLVSHDRYLIDALATQIWAIAPGRMEVFKGSYQEYVAFREAARALAAQPASPSPSKGAPARSGANAPAPRREGLSPREREKRIAAVEEAIHRLEVHMVEIAGDLEAASAAGEVDRVRALGELYARTQAEIDAKLEEWETLLAS
jgi:ATP-binding cassette subfamily F protein 3